jgi:hypothetical protein
MSKHDHGDGHGHGPAEKDATKLPEALAKKANSIALGVTAVGALGTAAGFAMGDMRTHTAFAYLASFTTVTSLCLGALFFVLIHHLTKAGWSVAARRHMEWIASALPVLAIFFVPVMLFSHDIYHHWMSEEAKHDAAIHAKAAWLNPTGFYVRAGIYFVIWTALAVWFARTSRAQDDKGDPASTAKMQAFAAPAMFLFALSLTFAAFDWLMSLDPHWYSTIFGVYIFAGGVTSALSALSLITIWLQKEGLLRRVSTVEHQHDIGKLLFGFIVFYAYIAFSQYFLIWYANIPEETIFYKERWIGSWQTVSLLIVFGHFVIPFFGIMSRHAKRNRTTLGFFAVWMIVMHWVDHYWLVMPTLDHHGAHFTWVDPMPLLMIGGVVAMVAMRRASREPLYPLKDPRLPETVQLVNL